MSLHVCSRMTFQFLHLFYLVTFCITFIISNLLIKLLLAIFNKVTFRKFLILLLILINLLCFKCLHSCICNFIILVFLCIPFILLYVIYLSSSCFTHRRKLLPFLHFAHVYCLLCCSIFVIMLCVCSLNGPFSNKFFSKSVYYPYIHCSLPFYQPIPKPSLCPSLDFIPTSLCNQIQVHTKILTPKKRKSLLIFLLLLISGDIEVNPGPSLSSLNITHLNIRSASVITKSIDKPAVL